MAEHSPNAMQNVSDSRRTVLLILGYEVSPIMDGIYDHARRAGWHVVNLYYYGMEVPRPFRADGVISDLDPKARMLRQLLGRGVPLVQLGPRPEPRCCRVVQDQRAGGEAAAEHFAERGFRNMAYLHSEEFADSPTRPMAMSFVARARRLGARADLIAVQRPGSIVGWHNIEALAKRFAREISRLELPLGIFTYNDTMAIRICEFCDAIGLRVPEQVAVLGRGNETFRCDFAPTPLSSVDLNGFVQGRTAAELLERLMDGEPAPKEPILIAPAGVVTRHSTDVLAVPDIDTAKALRYMWEHLAEPLSVTDIAEAVGVSRRKLDRHFRTHLHRTVNAELTRKRIERCCELLIGTGTSVRAITEQVGFTSENYLFKVFRAAMGTTPKQYRLAHRAKSGEAENGRLKPQP